MRIMVKQLMEILFHFPLLSHVEPHDLTHYIVVQPRSFDRRYPAEIGQWKSTLTYTILTRQTGSLQSQNDTKPVSLQTIYAFLFRSRLLKLILFTEYIHEQNQNYEHISKNVSSAKENNITISFYNKSAYIIMVINLVLSSRYL